MVARETAAKGRNELFTVLRTMPLPLEGSANLAHKGA